MLVCGRALVMLFKVFTGIVFTRATDCAIAPLARGARSTRRAALGRGPLRRRAVSCHVIIQEFSFLPTISRVFLGKACASPRMTSQIMGNFLNS